MIILDDVQEIFTPEEFPGHYQSQYQIYQTFFSKIKEIEHQSNLILVSQEKCQEMHCFDEELYPVKCLNLEGNYHINVLKNQGLKDEELWLKLIKLYEGNPTFLKDIANLIKDVFLGKVSDFLAEDTMIFTENMKIKFCELFNRLSLAERQISLKLSQFNQPLSRDDLRENLELSSIDLINGLQSLRRRYLLNAMEVDKTVFRLSPVFHEYLRSCGEA